MILNTFDVLSKSLDKNFLKGIPILKYSNHLRIGYVYEVFLIKSLLIRKKRMDLIQLGHLFLSLLCKQKLI